MSSCLGAAVVALLSKDENRKPNSQLNLLILKWLKPWDYYREIPFNGIISLSNFMKINQAVQKISIDLLYLKAINAFRSSCSHSNITAFMSFLTHSKIHTLVTIVTSAKDCMLCNHGNPQCKHPKPLLSKAKNHWYNYLTNKNKQW
jgi:hypothetical protein